MARAQKFGTFGGVFVPSVLTILGVIMYLRLGWVVGNAGLVGTIVIIAIAHIISITTGLSVASIATDRKVKAGGIYYMLSRSLGLPIGGAIGVALFVATALSISMYIVGFGESFNNVIGLSSIDTGAIERVNNLRITGTITLVIVTTIALVSTSAAIKTQYYILGAIVLSLVSIFAGGLFLDHEFSTLEIPFFSGERSASMETVFAIFFPAVTGFTAGVAMSGDLKDPKKSIPIGTMAAIAVGLVVYIGLAIFLSVTVDSQTLMEDTNILAKIALFSAYGAPFLMAGIWGATLSSALGGILGGPRILQAMSLDQVTPRIFGKGVGKFNEPRNALLFCFVIAEAGILIGELDLIAPIVSMFYLSAYGFINLTSALESWSGSDFRPTFRIPRAVSLLGAIATFAVMFKLDMFAMFASFIAIGIIFLYLTKKQINLGFSDVWQGVWSEVVRTALSRMSQSAPDKRSWRPNVILFSGSTDRRPHLLEYGAKLVGKLGLLSNFDLIEDQSTKVLFAKREQAVETNTSGKGVFTRQYSCNDIYSGIERIAETYGFSGLEPNTILMGWARYSKHPIRFSQLINKIQQLDYSMLIMDYDQPMGFGNKKRIDIWWEGTGRHLSFVLTISRFLNSSEDWQDAFIRLYVLADTSRVDDMIIYKILDQTQEELRVKLDVKIINSALGQKSLYETVKSESDGADLVYLELPDLIEGSEEEFFRNTDALCKEIGTVVLYKASRDFETIDLGIDRNVLEYPGKETEIEMNLESLPAAQIPYLTPPVQPIMAENFQLLDTTIEGLTQDYYNLFLIPFVKSNVQLVQAVQELVTEFYNRFRFKPTSEDESFVRLMNQQEKELMQNVLHQVEGYQSHQLRSQEQILSNAVDHMLTEIDQIIAKCPPYLFIEYPRNVLSDQQYSNFDFQQRIKSKLTKNPLQYRFEFQKMTTLQLKHHFQNALLEIHKQLNQHSDQFGDDLRKYIRRIIAGVQNLKNDSVDQSFSEKLAFEAGQIDQRLEELKHNAGIQVNAYRDFLLNDSRTKLQLFVEEVDEIRINRAVSAQLGSKRHWNQLPSKLKEAVAAWGYNQPFNFNVSLLEIRLQLVERGLGNYVDQLKLELLRIPQEKVLQNIDQLIITLQKLEGKFKSEKHPKLAVTHEIAEFSKLTKNVNDFGVASKDTVDLLPAQLLVPNPQNSSRDPSEEIDTIEISPLDVVNYFVQTNLIAPIEEGTEQMHALLARADHTISDVLQVVSLSLDSVVVDTSREAEDFSTKVIATINEEIARLVDEKHQVEHAMIQLTNELTANFAVVSQNLNAHSIIKSALDFDYYLLTQKQTQVINKFTLYSQNTKNYILGGLTKLYYSRSEGLIAAKRFQSKKVDFGTWTNRISIMMNEITPDDQVMESLPFYYKQLFLRPHSVGRELWLVRNFDTVEAEQSIVHYRKIRSGGLLILGTPLSGKTYLSEFVAKSYFEEERIFEVNPPEEGSVDAKVLHRSIKKSLKYYGELESAFDHLKADSVLIFNDVEQWWERGENGFEVLDILMDLIDKHSQKILFIINMNLLSFHLINSIKKMEESFFKILNTHPFNAEELKDVILSRHKTSRLKFEIEGKHEEGLTEWNQAKLFTKYFDMSQGNVGVALQQWASNIESISDNGLIQIRYPKLPDQELLNNIDKDRAIVLIQFILHKRLTKERLTGILSSNHGDLEKQLEVLHRLDFLKNKNEVWEINRFLLPFLVAAFQEDLLI